MAATRLSSASPGTFVFQLSLLVVLLALLGLAPTARADDCATVLDSDDTLRFIPANIEVPKACKTYTVTLRHSGKLPKVAVAHNWVLVKKADLAGVARTGMTAGAGTDYVDPRDARVIAHTKLIGTGEADSVTFAVSALRPDQEYAFLCTFAGHSPIMQGTLTLQK